ncbi:hypothetical protein IEO21_00625 [Rhodonia placenta]|uniref:Alpha/beta hydrolase fold-3 domain-containing protein n=1 Tax=Rhodonia placenta TaxID=104341 RepID=A0A8H7PB91_9APHY|nr:hypothetical protein IEO21_00625 [Postia placenta]
MSSPQTHPTSIDEHLSIPYISTSPPNPFHHFDLYVPNPTPPAKPPLICFVHGGAWRSEDKADHAALARRLAARTRCPVALPNYRLTTPATPLRHPAHAADLLAFLHFLLAWPGPADADAHGPPYDPTALYLIGHSCSAHMLTSIFLQPPSPAPPPSSADALPPAPVPTPDTLRPAPALLAATRALALSSGLYDLDLLLRAFPAYKSWFVAPAFGRLRTYAPWNTAAYTLRAGAAHPRWLLVHSTGDTLVHRAQSEAAWAALRALYGEEGDGDGDAEQGGRRMVERAWDSLTEEHNEALAGEAYPRVVGDFILDDMQWRASARGE